MVKVDESEKFCGFTVFLMLRSVINIYYVLLIRLDINVDININIHILL